jgi:hypothetical protein
VKVKDILEAIKDLDPETELTIKAIPRTDYVIMPVPEEDQDE